MATLPALVATVRRVGKVEHAVTAMGPKLQEVRDQLDLLRNDLSGLPFVQKS